MTSTSQQTNALPGPAPDARRISVAILFALGAYTALVAVVLSILMNAFSDHETFTPNRITEVHHAMLCHGIAAAVVCIAALAVRRQRRLRPLWPRVIVLLAVLALVGSADRIVGILYPPPSSLDSILAPHPMRGWAHRRNAIGTGGGVLISINAHGLRSPAIPLKKIGDEFRILFAGDSVTFGYGLPRSDLFVTQTAELLRKRSPETPITAINAGVSGYATWQELDYLREDGMAFEPDLLIVQYCLNDVVELRFLDPGQISGGVMRFDFSNTNHWSGILRAIRSVAVHRQWRETLDAMPWASTQPISETGGLPNIREVFQNPNASMEAAWQRALADLDAMDEFCAARELPWVLVLVPVRSQFGDDSILYEPQVRLRAWAKRRGVRLLDLLPAFQRKIIGAAAEPGMHYFLDDTHPNARGNGLVATTLADYLLRERLVSRPARP